VYGRGGEGMRVLIVICTRQRPRLLDACLASVCAQRRLDGVEMQIAVIENNDRLSCREQIERHSRDSGIPIHAVLEPELGIPFVRNRCGIFAAENGFDWALYIDDDETAEPDWFATMVEAARRFDADVLYGRVVPVYPEDAPLWMIEPAVNKRPTGALLTKAEGHNTMVRTRVFRDDGLALRFDTSLRFAGGSDTDFFSRVHAAGGRIVWVGEAVVNEITPPNRLTLKWQLKRAFRVAISIAVLHEKQRGRGAAVRRTIVKGAGRLLGGLVRLPLALVAVALPDAGRRWGFQALKQVASGLGSFAFLVGIRPQPYRQVDGN
jgi:succinoglycan biosynthesis protein ExoM